MSKVLKARARRMDNGEWIVGHPFETWNYRRTERVTYMALDNPCEVHADGAVMNLRAVMVDPATLGYETSKQDCKGNMIYGGMKVRVEFFGYHFFVRWDNKKSAWYLEHSKEPASELSMMLWEKRSEALEIIDEKEEAK